MSEAELQKKKEFLDTEFADAEFSASEAEFEEAIHEGDFLLARPIEAQEQGLALRFLKASYAESELHSTGALLARFAEPRCQALFLIHNPQTKPTLIGLSQGWQLYDFYFLEYLAMDAEAKPGECETLTRRWLTHLTRQQARVLLSVTPPSLSDSDSKNDGAGLGSGDEAQLSMLRDLGFRCLTEDYLQPALRGTDVPLRHWLLGTGAWDDLPVDQAIQSLYRAVYAHAMERPQNRGLLDK